MRKHSEEITGSIEKNNKGNTERLHPRYRTAVLAALLVIFASCTAQNNKSAETSNITEAAQACTRYVIGSKGYRIVPLYDLGYGKIQLPDGRYVVVNTNPTQVNAALADGGKTIQLHQISTSPCGGSNEFAGGVDMNMKPASGFTTEIHLQDPSHVNTAQFCAVVVEKKGGDYSAQSISDCTATSQNY